MDTKEYDKFVELMNFVPQTREYLAIALGGEAGEVLNEVKKEMRPGSTSRRMLIAYELGDTLYYLTAMAKYYGFTLGDIISFNIEKLKERQRQTGVPSNA